MSNVASKDLCEVLYGLSGWRSGRFFFEALPGVFETAQDNDFEEDDVPAYDLGYLLRKLEDYGVQLYQNPHRDIRLFLPSFNAVFYQVRAVIQRMKGEI